MFCTVCFVDILVSHGGRQDITSQIAAAKHVSYAKAGDTMPSVSCFLGTDNQMSVIGRETLLIGSIVEDNLPFARADQFGQLVRRICQDSKIAQIFSCARTKAASIINFMADNSALTDFQVLLKLLLPPSCCLF